jgi:hypothetical protein
MNDSGEQPEVTRTWAVGAEPSVCIAECYRYFWQAASEQKPKQVKPGSETRKECKCMEMILLDFQAIAAQPKGRRVM